MNNSQTENILLNLREINSSVSPELKKGLRLDFVERVVRRLDEFAPSCMECSSFYDQIAPVIIDFRSRSGSLTRDDSRALRKIIRKIVAHLQKKHKLVHEGYYLSLFMSIGLALGVSIGVSMHNTGIGTAIGIAIGVALGVGQDAEAKKKGLLI